MDNYNGNGIIRSSTPIRARSQRSLHEPGGSGGGGGSGAGASGGMSNGNGVKNARNNTRELYQSHHYTTNNNLTTGTNRRSNGNSSRSPTQYHQYTYATNLEDPTMNGDNSLYSPTELRKQVDELQELLSKMKLENEFIQYELLQTKSENEQLQHIIREKDKALAKMRHHSETLIQFTYTLYEKLRQFKVRYYQEKNGLNVLFNDPSPEEDG